MTVSLGAFLPNLLEGAAVTLAVATHIHMTYHSGIDAASRS